MNSVYAMHARLRRVRTRELSPNELRAIRELLDAAFGGRGRHFSDDDWQHALGGMHIVLEIGREIVAHASVVERELRVGGVSMRTGYVEAVATAPAHHGRGFGTEVMRDVGAYITEHFALGALSSSRHGFYERLQWRIWRGPSSVRSPSGERPTPEEDGHILVLTTPATRDIDFTVPISCDWRPGDVW